jgi:zinc-ribbon domain
MAFCNSCGASLAEGTKFCNQCGAAVAGNPSGMAAQRPAPAAIGAPPPSKDSSNALKIILIMVGAIVLLGVVGLGTLAIVGIHLARRAHVTQDGEHVKVETPFGTVESSKDPEQAAKDLGIDIYPGAEAKKAGAASATFAGIRTVSVNFESSDSVDKVCSFYRSKLSVASVSTSENHCTIVSNVPPNMITVNAESEGEGSKFQISAVTKKSASNQ